MKIGARNTRTAARAALVGGALLVGVGALVGCSSSSDTSTAPVNTTAPPNTAPQKKVFRETDTNIAVTPGEDFVIRVKSNASAGEQWNITTEADPSVAKLTKQSYLSLPDAPPGAPGREEFAFTAGKAGTTTFAIENCLLCKPSTASTVAASPSGTTPPPTTYTFTIRVG